MYCRGRDGALETGLHQVCARAFLRPGRRACPPRGRSGRTGEPARIQPSRAGARPPQTRALSARAAPPKRRRRVAQGKARERMRRGVGRHGVCRGSRPEPAPGGMESGASLMIRRTGCQPPAEQDPIEIGGALWFGDARAVGVSGFQAGSVVSDLDHAALDKERLPECAAIAKAELRRDSFAVQGHKRGGWRRAILVPSCGARSPARSVRLWEFCEAAGNVLHRSEARSGPWRSPAEGQGACGPGRAGAGGRSRALAAPRRFCWRLRKDGGLIPALR